MIEKDRQEELRSRQRGINYASEIRRQICEKEQEKIAERNAFFDEGVRMEEEARLRHLRLEEAKRRKLNELNVLHPNLDYLPISHFWKELE
ncbi:unnamed protein product [Protopolystoma xenopodis]|uniref:Cilia- and flagella-associated protein 45 n=1 Tax=Protopolystoma xenopodis TaxID=117903 RepID=A0A3S5BUP6_9PLAT|nr:unnamed protein product [Protopolystoma xenopodis]